MQHNPSLPAPHLLRSRTAYYLLFNGILGDKRPAGGNVLTHAVLQSLLQLHAATPHPDAPLVVYSARPAAWAPPGWRRPTWSSSTFRMT